MTIVMKKIAYLIPIFVLVGCGSDSASEDELQNEEQTINEEIPEEAELVIDISLNKLNEVPKECKVEGDLVDIYSWKDLNGSNYFIRSIGAVKEGKELDGLPTQSQYLYAYHYVENSTGEFELKEDIVDFVKDCEFDIILGHELDAISLTDLDSNEVGEISFVYRTSCTSDVSPSTQKLMLLEDGQKYALRGSTQVMGFGGEYEADDSFNDAPAAFLSHAKSLWEDHIIEFDFEL